MTRTCSIEVGVASYAEGSALIQCGLTKVWCTVSVIEGVPRFMKDKKGGWLTAEYSMLPRATHTRSDREAVRGKQSGRTQEIQRLIGRSLRSAVDLSRLPAVTLAVDCDVMQADGSTRMAAVTGACVALFSAIQTLQYQKKLKVDPIRHWVTGVSVGMVHGQICGDLNYAEDSAADTDLNVVWTEHGDLVEVQGTAEGKPLAPSQLHGLLSHAQSVHQARLAIQKQALGIVETV